MPTQHVDDPVPEHVTIIEELDSRGNGGVILGILALLLIAVAGFWLLTRSGTVDPSDASIAAAADKVGAAAEQVGDAATDAANKIN